MVEDITLHFYNYLCFDTLNTRLYLFPFLLHGSVDPLVVHKGFFVGFIVISVRIVRDNLRRYLN